MLRPLAEPEARRRGAEIYARLDEIADAPPDDPRVAVLAADLADHLPERLAVLMVEQEADVGWMEELSAAQREVFRQLSRILRERAC